MSRYRESHMKPAGPGDNKVFLATGCSSSIGIETGRALAATGGKVLLAVRELEKGKAACESILEPSRIELIELDTSKMDSVRTCCNAAVMDIPQHEESVNECEMHLATNYLGRFLLFWLLRDSMLKAPTPEFNSRLVNVSSAAHHASEVFFDDFPLKCGTG
ncbi:hypothetical protein F5B22DRAFT_645662 [Xylaria bambusicola]|uniref:uncharacterized protein n=1 Tax=Xylaria bambusicola TaxID=326684 RepID=UPI002008954A|nr:uncharacterized protein F5B22DRAFT_645662 [Xylaria bambusicola]KAI0517480.1 hypothetical protein F5B22DRAFT_645662 [Xylaria bambusicola]